MEMNAFEELRWRGLVFESMEGVEDLLARQKITVYNGFDPTGNSLHIGHIVPLIQLARLQRHGHSPIAVAGGGTGMVGDPSGRSSERNLLTREQIEQNLVSIKAQLAHFLDFEVKSNPARVINNADWLLDLRMIDFLRDIGKHFTINYMLAKDSVRNRLEREDGMSFTEFSYMLMQSYDFLHLFQTTGCVLQTGGSDQWGNITAGAELIRRVLGKSAYGLVYPLITRADGSKYGKTSDGSSVWLDPKRTSPYRFYQFWLNTDDRDTGNFLRYFTFLERERIAELEASLAARPELREAQRTLAREMTVMIHGETALARAEQASQALFGGDVSGLSAAEIEDIFAEVPSTVQPRQALEGAGMPAVDLLVAGGAAKSRGEARRTLDEGGMYLNNQRMSAERLITGADLLADAFLILRKGKRSYFLVRVQ